MGWDEEGNSFTWRGGTPPTPPIPPVLLMSAACCPCLQAGGNRTVFGASFLHGWGDTARSIPLTEVAPLCFWRVSKGDFGVNSSDFGSVRHFMAFHEDLGSFGRFQRGILG